ncbi:MAG TPA: hypothetical protein DEA08_30625, partial [Planctomycetes bacterium]|nr:hypothetical protein [Planctomycetota bacterium]
AGRAAATFGATLLATILARFYDDVRDQARRQRAELERLRSEWVAVVSHELRTPLTAIRGSLGLIDAGALDDDPQQRREAIAIAHRNAKSLGRLVDELLDVERITSGELSLHLEEADAVQLAKGAVATFRELAAQREVGLELAAPAQLPLRADAGRLTQVLHNLISNALKFSPAGGTVHVAVTSGAERVRFSVRDGGPGISAEFAPRLFERFTQEDSSTERKTAGSGLGLYVSKAIVEQHGGQIGFENDPGGGCVFSVVLPLSLR